MPVRPHDGWRATDIVGRPPKGDVLSELNEKTVLLRYLTVQRRHILDSVEGLTDDQFGLAPLPSGWSITAMLNHLALDDEMFWFEKVFSTFPAISVFATLGVGLWRAHRAGSWFWFLTQLFVFPVAYIYTLFVNPGQPNSQPLTAGERGIDV